MSALMGHLMAPDADTARRWDHFTKRVNGIDLDAELEAFSDQGWELVAVVHLAHDLEDSPYRLFFKRLIDGGVSG